jgi:hypothetical protein
MLSLRLLGSLLAPLGEGEPSLHFFNEPDKVGLVFAEIYLSRRQQRFLCPEEAWKSNQNNERWIVEYI